MRTRQRTNVRAARAPGRRRLAACAVWLAGALAPGLAAPDSVQAAELSARGPAACPDVAEMTFRVERAIGMPLSRAAPLRFSVTFQEGAVEYAAQLEVEGEQHARAAARRFSAADCSRLGDAVGLAIALALGAQAPAEPEVAALASNGAPASEPAGALPAVSVPARPSVPRDEPVPSTSADGAAPVLTPVLSAVLIADSGSLPAAGLGMSVAAELRFRRLALRVGALLLFDQHTELRPTELSAAGAELGLALGSASLCTVAFGDFRAPLAGLVCGGWEVGRIEGTGTGIRAPRRASALWTAPRLDAQLSWGPGDGPVRLSAQLSAAIPLKRDDFFLRDLGSVHRPPVVVGRVGLGLEVSFE